MQFIQFMTSTKGRAARIIAGLIIVGIGLFVVQGTVGVIMSVVALLPISGGVLDFCVAGAAMGYPFKGGEARAQLASESHAHS